MTSEVSVAAILAGGRSRRFGGERKALVSLKGQPLIQHVIDRLTPQVSLLALSVDQKNPAFDYLGFQQIEDPEPGVEGPLPALLASLRWLKGRDGADWLQLAPCDTPFLPDNLSRRLMQAALREGTPGAVPSSGEELQPACALWHRDLLDDVEQAVARGMKGFKEFLQLQPLATLRWPATPADRDPFFNINTPEDLSRAEEYLAPEYLGSE